MFDHVAILENQIIFQDTYNTEHPKNSYCLKITVRKIIQKAKNKAYVYYYI